MIIFIPGIPKNSNASSQWARYAASRDRKTFRQRTAEIAAQADWQQIPFTIVTARHVSPVKRRRDPTGLAERLKGILDGLVDAGLLPDDDEDHIEVVLARSIRGPQAGIQITLERPASDNRQAEDPARYRQEATG